MVILIVNAEIVGQEETTKQNVKGWNFVIKCQNHFSKYNFVTHESFTFQSSTWKKNLI